MRIRFPGHLLDWAVVGTMAMWGKGVQMKYHRNTYLKAFTCVEKIAFKHLNKIWSKTKTERDAIIRAQIYMHHSSDNCQEYHAFATQRRNQPGVMHTARHGLQSCPSERVREATRYCDERSRR